MDQGGLPSPSPLPSPPSGLRCPFLPGLLAVKQFMELHGWRTFSALRQIGGQGTGAGDSGLSRSVPARLCYGCHRELGWRLSPNQRHLHVSPSEITANLQGMTYKGYLLNRGYQASHPPVPRGDRPGTRGETPGRAFLAPSSNHICPQSQSESLTGLR